jgi:hypothetical protein
MEEKVIVKLPPTLAKIKNIKIDNYTLTIPSSTTQNKTITVEFYDDQYSKKSPPSQKIQIPDVEHEITYIHITSLDDLMSTISGKDYFCYQKIEDTFKYLGCYSRAELNILYFDCTGGHYQNKVKIPTTENTGLTDELVKQLSLYKANKQESLYAEDNKKSGGKKSRKSRPSSRRRNKQSKSR